MQIQVKPGRAEGIISAPPSKSMAHRLLICAALSDGVSRISNIAYSEDILATLDCIREMGAELTVEEDSVTVTGIKRSKVFSGLTFSCRESGSTMRFFMGISMLSPGSCTFTGSETLLSRPFRVYEDICRERGMSFIRRDGEIELDGALTSGDFTIPGNISSQFITGLLFVLPLLAGDSTITLTENVESSSYLDLTVAALSEFGVKVVRIGDSVLKIPGNQSYKPRNISVEGDFSNAAFLEVFNLFSGKVSVRGLSEHSLQGDRIYREYFKALQEKNVVLDISDCPDLGPILFAAAAVLNGALFTGTRRLKMKESDRGTVMCKELASFGVRSKLSENEIRIYPATLTAPTEPLSGHNDHRIVMSLVTLLTLTGGRISGAEAVRKSFPDYYTKLRELGIEVEEIGMD